jgi:hypothetical protein
LELVVALVLEIVVVTIRDLRQLDVVFLPSLFLAIVVSLVFGFVVGSAWMPWVILSAGRAIEGHTASWRWVILPRPCRCFPAPLN